jgi:polar amino acid transport system ATP-binding protein
MIQFDKVSKAFGEVQAVDGVSLHVNAGTICALLGPSGSGKSTLLRLVNRLVEPDAGQILVRQQDISRLPPVELRRRIGYVIQSIGLFPHWTVARNIATVPDLVGWPSGRVEARTRELMELVELDPALHGARYPDELSGGQQQRVAIARALAMQPIALLCDEITSALDPELVNEVLAVVKELAGEGMTLMMVTHEMRFAREVCSRVVFMHQGRVHEIGPPEEVFAGPRTPELRQFLGVQ